MTVDLQDHTSSSTSNSLLHRVKQQEPEAWRRFVTLYGPVVYRWCTTSGLQANDAADVVQDVFQAVFQGIAKFQRQENGQSLRGWLWTVTRNKVADHYRRRESDPVLDQTLAQQILAPEQPSEADSSEKIGPELAHRALRLLQTDFEPTTWQAFWAVAVDGLTVAETATQLGLSPAAVYKAKSRVLNRLRVELDGLLE